MAVDETLLRALYDEGLLDDEVAARVGVSRHAVGRWRRRNGLPANGGNNARRRVKAIDPPPPASETDQIKHTESGDEGTLESVRSERIKTLDQLLAEADVDLTTWTVERYTVNKWEVGAKDADGKLTVAPLFQVKAYLKRNREAVNLLALRDQVIEEMAAHAPQYPAFPAVQVGSDPHMLEISAFDLHFGKLAWAEEVDGENYDSKIADKVLDRAVEELVRKARGFDIEKILFPVGNDLLHADTPEGTTTRGTRQDVDTRPLAMFCRARDAMVRTIDRLMEVAPVHVIVVPGNHDRENALRLGVVLDAWYRNTDRVEVDAAPTLRKYVTYGINLLGFTHGSEEKHRDLPLIMAQERPVEWANSLHREWHTGHLHLRRETRYNAGDTHGGVVVRVIPSLAGTDAWHFSRGYTKGQRAAEAYLWSRHGGYGGHFSANILKAA